MKKFLLIAMVFNFGLAFAQKTGDIAFIGYNTDGLKAFSVVALSDIDGSVSSKEIFFTDDDWNGSALAGGEGTITWTISTLIVAGTVVDFTDVSGSVAVSVGTASESNAFFPINGSDAVYCYVGTLGNPSTFLAAITNDDFTNDSFLLTGTGLTVGTNAIELDVVDTDADIAEYTGTRTGIRSLLETSINDANNWITQDDSGDQSIDAIEPDVPFDATSFVITSITWDGSEEDQEWGNANNWDSGTVPTSADNVVIADVSFNPIIGPLTSEDFAVNNLTINTGGDLSVTSGSSLAIFGDVINNGTYSIARNSEGSGGYSIMSSPVTNETFDDLTDADFVYSVITTSFSSNLAGTATTINPGQGYFVGSNAMNPVIEFSGTPNSGTITYGVTSDNFELAGNPYSAAISISDFLTENASLINSAVYFWDDGGSNSATSGKRGGDYITTNGLGTASAMEPLGLEDDVTGKQGTGGAVNGYIPSAQGFFVYATATGTLSFTQAMQVTTSGANVDANHYRIEEIEYQKVKLAISGNELYNEILVGLGEDATLGRDSHLDAKKFVTTNPLSFYSLIEDEKYVIQGLPLAGSEIVSTKLGFDIAEAGTFTMSVVDFENIPDNMNVTLVDHSTGFSYDLRSVESFEFTSEIATNDQRFELRFSVNDVLSVGEAPNELTIFGSTSELRIHSTLEGNHNVVIYSLDGKVAFNENVNFTNKTVVINPNLTRNKVYVLRLGEQSFKFVIQ